MAIESLLGKRSHDEGIYRLSATKPSRDSAMRTVTIVEPVLMRRIGNPLRPICNDCVSRPRPLVFPLRLHHDSRGNLRAWPL